MSYEATLNMFDWYRGVEGGVLLEETRQKHPWIMYDSDEDPQDEDSSDDGTVFHDVQRDSRIRSWQDGAVLHVF